MLIRARSEETTGAVTKAKETGTAADAFPTFKMGVGTAIAVDRANQIGLAKKNRT